MKDELNGELISSSLASNLKPFGEEKKRKKGVAVHTLFDKNLSIKITWSVCSITSQKKYGRIMKLYNEDRDCPSCSSFVYINLE